MTEDFGQNTSPVNPEDKIPPSFEKFVGKTPLQVFENVAPSAKNLEAISALCAGLGVDLGIDAPNWAKVAAQKFFEAISVNSVDDISIPALTGQLAGLVELVPPSKNSGLKSEALAQFAKDFCQNSKAEAANASTEYAKAFFNARADAGKVLQKIKSLPQRVKVYIIIAAMWPLIAELGSAAKLHTWLIKGRFILPNTDAADTRTVCRSIGLKFASKPGRPRKRKTGR
jgi:hypothetical protein